MIILISTTFTFIFGAAIGYIFVIGKISAIKDKSSENEKESSQKVEEARIEAEKAKVFAENCSNLYEENKVKVQKLSEENLNLSEFKGQFLQSEKVIQSLKNELQNLISEKQELQEENTKLLTNVRLVQQERSQLEQSKKEWEVQTKETLANLVTELSKKNLENVAKNNQVTEEKITEITKNTVSEIQKVINKVSSLDDDMKKSEQSMSKFTRALLGEGSRGIGKLSEITLNNLLQNAGLRKKGEVTGDYDYELQLVLENNSRPDAVIYLPHKQIIVIDSKSSPFFAELESVESLHKQQDEVTGEFNYTPQQKAMLTKIKERMNQHLNDLKKRRYDEILEKEIEEKYFNEGDKEVVKLRPRITQVMFLQTEEMLYKIREADDKFFEKALKENILVLSPAGLYNFLASAKYVINSDRQNKSWTKTVKEIQHLLNNFADVFNGMNDLGKKMTQAFASYNKLSGKLNRNLLTRARNINKLGFAQVKELPNKIKSYSLEEESSIIDVSLANEEGEAVEGLPVENNLLSENNKEQ